MPATMPHLNKMMDALYLSTLLYFTLTQSIRDAEKNTSILFLNNPPLRLRVSASSSFPFCSMQVYATGKYGNQLVRDLAGIETDLTQGTRETEDATLNVGAGHARDNATPE